MNRFSSRQGKKRVNRFSRTKSTHGLPKYKPGDVVGSFTIESYLGHSAVNKRTAKFMTKAQHWYTCLCDCRTKERRSQQELIDVRRQQMCFKCRDPVQEAQCELT